MNSEALKFNIAQRILGLNDESVLVKISKLLDKENVVGFEMDGNPIAEKHFVADIEAALNLLSEGKLETYSSQEIKRKIQE
ncbi:MAG TPA: hypothetical protein VK476_07660 [Flavobacterium sp.]|nr:hypothetical protein [Flavobacterium sp.]